MARKTEKGHLSGVVGKLVFYEMYGDQYSRMRPAKKKKKRNEPPNPLTTVFGEVSKYGSAMMNDLKLHLLFPFTLFTYNDQRAWMRNQYATHKDDPSWEMEPRRMNMSQLNREVDLRDFWDGSLAISDEGNGIVSITIPPLNPAFDLKAPLNTVKVNLKLFLLSSPFIDNTGFNYSLDKDQYSFDYGQNLLPSKTFTLDSKKYSKMPTSGHIALVAMALEFETKETGAGMYSKDLKWLPAAIVAMGRLK